MKHSISFYLVLLVLKIQGQKKMFSLSPVDYDGLRKQDVRRPKGKFYKADDVYSFDVNGFKVTAVESPVRKSNGKLMIYLHGGAFVSGPGQHHWDTVQKIYKKTDLNIWVYDYPKAPEYTSDQINASVDALYKKALESYDASDIIVMGDSAGGTLALTLSQRLESEGVDKPRSLVLVSPVVDASMENPAIDQIEPKDPILSVAGVRSAKQMFAGEKSLKHPSVSPIYGSFDNFPNVILYIGGRDIAAPDQELLAEVLKEKGVGIDVVYDEKMIHIWPLLPVMKEAKLALDGLISKLNNLD